MNDKYLEFHRLKKEITNKLNSIADGDRMDSYCNNFLEDITVSDQVDEIVEMVNELQRLELILSASEGN